MSRTKPIFISSRLKFRLVFFVFLLLFSLSFCLYFGRQFVSAETERSRLLQQRSDMDWSRKLLETFQQRYNMISESQGDISNVRVRWRERLDQRLSNLDAGVQDIRYAIEDQQVVTADGAETPSTATIYQYPLSVNAKLLEDAHLVSLLLALAGKSEDIIDNRGCRIRKEPDAGYILVDCLYALYDVVSQESSEQ